MKRILFDLESDGLLDNVTKIHCVSYRDIDSGEKNTLTNYQDYINLFSEENLTLIGHNIIQYDVPVLEKLLNIKITARLIDTLALSWYLSPEKKVHGLEEWGEIFGVPKPVIIDWSNQALDDYIHRCQEDVEINNKLLNYQIDKLNKIYAGADINRIMGYLSYKMQCAREQSEVKWKLDVDKANEVLSKLEAERELKKLALIEAMPQYVKYGKTSKPNKLFVKDGSISAQGEKWFYLLGQRGLPINHEEDIEIEIVREPGNPSSVIQLKKWLFDLGWIPQEFKYVKEEKDGKTFNRPVPQINTQDDGMCPSVKLLFDKAPGLVNLESLGIISHRIGILEGWLRDVDDEGFLKAEIAGLTNTLRFQHRILVNIPTIHKPYGQELRECLIAPDDNHILCGSDLSGAEESTKHHYMYYYDPGYVEEMRQPGFDPHLDIALEAKMLTKQQVEGHKSGKEKHAKVRWNAKRVNFAATYGAGIPKIVLTSGMAKAIATILHTAYWKRNWAIKRIANDVTFKNVDGQLWLYNPVSQFWYSLRYEKDKFSTLNQGTAVYCFDTWVSHIREKGIRICGQFHDEIIFPLLKGTEERYKQLLLDAIDEANEELKLNIKLSISVDFGNSYSEIH